MEMPDFIERIHPLVRVGIVALLIMSAVFAYHNYKVSEEERTVGPFRALYIDGLMNVYLKQGETAKLSIRADDRILPQVKTVVENGILKVYTEGVIRGERIKEAYITYVQLDSIHAAGVGTLTSHSVLPLDSLLLRASRASEVRLQLQAQQLNLLMSGHANVQLAGTVNELLCQIQDKGDLMAYHLKANKAKVDINTGPQSPGVARIHVLDSLWATVKGPRHLYFQGEPRFVEKVVDEQGRVVQQ